MSDLCNSTYSWQRHNIALANANKIAIPSLPCTQHKGQLPQTDRASALVSPKILATIRGVVHPGKIFSRLVWSPCKMWLLSLMPCARMKDALNFGDAGAPRPWGSGWPPRNTLLPNVCYHIKFGRSILNRVGVGRGPKTFGKLGPRPLKMGACVNGNTTFP